MRNMMKKVTTWILIVAMLVTLLPVFSLSIFADTEIPHTYRSDSAYAPDTVKYAEYQLGLRSDSTLFTNLEDAANTFSYINYFTDDNTALTFSKAMQGHNFIPDQNWDEDPSKRTDYYFFKNSDFAGYAPQIADTEFDFRNVDFDYRYSGMSGGRAQLTDGQVSGGTDIFGGTLLTVIESNNPAQNSGGVFRVSTADTISCLYTNVGYINRDGESVPVAAMMDFMPTAITNNTRHDESMALIGESGQQYAYYLVQHDNFCNSVSAFVDIYDIRVTFLEQNAISQMLGSLAQNGSGATYESIIDHPIAINGTAIFCDIDAMQGIEFKNGFDSLNFHRNANGDSDVDRTIRQTYPDYDFRFLHYAATSTPNSLGYVHGTSFMDYCETQEIQRGLYTSVIATFSGEKVEYTATMTAMNGRFTTFAKQLDRYELPYYDSFDCVYNSGNTAANGGRAPYYTEFQSVITNSPDGADLTSKTARATRTFSNYNDSYQTGGVSWDALPYAPSPDITKKVSFAAPAVPNMPGASELYDSLAMTNAEAETDSFYYYIDINIPPYSVKPYTSLTVTDNLDNMIVRTSDIMVFKRPVDGNTWTDCTSDWTAAVGQANDAYTPYTYTAKTLSMMNLNFYNQVFRIVLKCSFNPAYLSDQSSVVANGIAQTQISTSETRKVAKAAAAAPLSQGAKAETTDASSENSRLEATPKAATASTYTVRFYNTVNVTNPGDLSSGYTTQTLTYGTNTALKAVTYTRSNYAFKGWHAYKLDTGEWLYTSTGSNKEWYYPGLQPAGYYLYAYADKATVSKLGEPGETVALFTVWQFASSSNYNRFQITYDGNGGYGTMADEVKGEATGTTSHTFTLKNNAFVRSGWTFIGWTRLANTSSDKLWMHTTSSGYGWDAASGIPSGQYYSIVKDGITLTPTTSNPRQELYAQWAKVLSPQVPKSVSSGTALGDISISGKVVANKEEGTKGILSGVRVTVKNSSNETVYTNSATVAASAASYNIKNLFGGNNTVLPDDTYTLSVSVETKYSSPTNINDPVEIFSDTFTVGNSFANKPNTAETLISETSEERNYNTDAAIRPAGTFMLLRANGDASNTGKSLNGSGAALGVPMYGYNQTFRFVLKGEGTTESPYYYEVINVETGSYLTDNGKGNAISYEQSNTSDPAQQWHLYQKDGANNTFYLYSGLNNYLTASAAGSAITGADGTGWVLRGVTMTLNKAALDYSWEGTDYSYDSNTVNVRISFPVTYAFESTSAQVELPEELNDYLPDDVDYLFYGESTDVTTDLTDGTNSVSIGDTVVDSNGLTWIYDVRDHTGGDTSVAYDNAAGKTEIVTDGTGWKLTDGAADVSSAAEDSTVTTTVKITDSTAELTSYWTPYARVFYEWDEDSPVPADADALIVAANNGETAIADTPLIQVGKSGNDINAEPQSSDSGFIFLGWYPSNDGSSVPTGKTISQITTGGTTTNVDSSVVVTEENFTMPAHNVYLEGLWVEMDLLAGPGGQPYYGVVDYILYDYSQEITYIPENFDRSVYSAVKKSGSTKVDMKKDTDYNDSDLLTDCEISATNVAETNGKITLSLAEGATAKDTDVLKYTTDIGFLNNTYCGRTIERTFPDGYTIYFVPASNVHYEESFLTYTGTWTDVSDSGTGVDNQEGLHPVHGYDAAYAAKTDANSNNAAKVTTVSAADNNHKASFTFTGNGFDIISRCSADSGTMLVYVYNQSNQLVETVLCDCWLDTTSESEYYQIPVVHKTDYPYGTYRVEVYALYNVLFDHNSKITRSAVTETKVRQMLNLPKNVPLSIERACSTDLSGFKAESKAVRSTASAGSYKIYIDGIRVYNPLGYTDTVNGPLNESSDNFNAAAAYLYGKENEFDPDYVQIRKVIVTGEETDDSGALDSNEVLYIASKGSFGLDADYTSGAVYLSTSGTQLAYHTDTTAVVVGTSSYYALLSDDDNSPLFYNADQATVSKNGTYQLYSKAGDSKNLYWYDSSEMHKIDGYGTMLFTDGKVDIQGPENEMYLQSGTAIGFIVEDYDADKIVHLSMKSPSGAPVTVYINGQANALTVKSRTEIYYDISAYVTDGTVVITTDAAGGNVLSVCNIKVTGRLLSVENRKTVRACPMATAYDTMLGIETEPDEQPTESENFGITSAYLRLNQDINVIYTAKLPENSENPYMIFTMNNIERKVTEYTVNDQGEYCFAFEGVTPQCMGDNICATLYATVNGTECSDTHSHYSVRTYCENTLARYAEDTKTVTLLSDLLTYGSAAQTYTSYKTETLVSDGLALNPSAYHEISGYGVSFSGEDADKACWCAASLTLSNILAVNMIFAADSVENLTIHVTVNGRTEIFAEEDFEDLGEGKFSISFRGILATEFDDVISASFYVGENQIGRTLNYSVNTYICGTQACGNANLEAIVKALYNYGASAKAYSEKAE